MMPLFGQASTLGPQLGLQCRWFTSVASLGHTTTDLCRLIILQDQEEVGNIQ